MTIIESSLRTLGWLEPLEVAGTVTAVRGLTVLVDRLPVPIGSLVRLSSDHSRTRENQAPGRMMLGEVVGFDGPTSIVMLLSQTDGVAPGMRVIGECASARGQTVQIGETMLGRVINGLGFPIDDGPTFGATNAQLLFPEPQSALDRARITEPLATGVRAIDGLLTVGRGQRLGIFSAAGVGKSTILGSIARHTSADVNVIGLIGERGREVREFIEESLGDKGMPQSVVVVATADESPLLRVRAAFVACAVAEFFRDQGADVMLMIDSITRFAQAQRQIGLAVGEPPATRGYTPSVFARMPELLERAGAIEGKGSITGFYSVLVEGDDMDEPISDAARGILDGHVVLSRRLAERGHFPAIDVLQSISRVARDVSDDHHNAARQDILRLLSAYQESEELINIGAYARGSNPDTDLAIALRPQLLEFLQQKSAERAEFPRTCRSMIELSVAAQQQSANDAGAVQP